VALLETGTGRSGLCLDPAAFDCFLQLGQVFKAADSTEVYVPAGLSALQVAAPQEAGEEAVMPAAHAWASAVPSPAAEAGTVRSDFRLASSAAASRVCSIAALTAKSMGQASARVPAADQQTPSVQRTDCLYEVAWRVADTVVSGEAGGERTLWQMSASEQRDPAGAAAGAIASVQRLLKGSAAGAVQLQTVGAALVPGSIAADVGRVRTAAAAALSGLVKTLNQEVPQTSWSSQDSDPAAAGCGRAGAAALVQLGANPGAADAFGSAARGGSRLAPLLLKSAAVEQLGPHHLFPSPRGSLNSLVPRPVDTTSLAPGLVLVAVRAVGINFRDVLNVLGMYPGDPGPPGGDCAGVVVAAGPGSSLSVGQPVFGLAAGSLGSHVIASAQTVVPLPASTR
jgi:hypothetical protein